MKVTYPRVVSIRRADPDRFSVGDEAVCEFGPGLFEFLQMGKRDGIPLGEGLAPEWTIPVGAACNAAYAVLFPARREDLNQFTGTGHTAKRFRPYDGDEMLLARAWIESLERRIVIGYAVVGHRSGDLLVEGRISFVAIGPGGPKSYDPRLYPKGSGQPEPSVASPAALSSPPKIRRPRVATALLPRELTRALKITYWHWRAPTARRSPHVFIAGLNQVLRDPGVHPIPNRAPKGVERLLDLTIPSAIADRLRDSLRRRREARFKRDGVFLRIHRAPQSLGVGETAGISFEVRNPTEVAIEAIVEVTEPFGFGLAVSWGPRIAIRLEPEETRLLDGQVTALRPDEVNLGKPWPVRCVVSCSGRELANETIQISVPDPHPGRIFYVLTEDCETFDGGGLTGDYGNAHVLGNHNDYMDPEDYRVQMIDKPNALNAIAERHGAAWTHFWTVPQRFAAVWAAEHSSTGAWTELVHDLDASVRRGSRRHEYAPHIHFDFEPDSKLPPQPRLVYDKRTDGILPSDYYHPATNRDHKYHGWDGARKGIAYVRAEGDLTTLDSKKGSLRKAVRYLADLSFGGLPSLTTRTGAADFGATPEDLDVSARALFANGLLANSDSNVYHTPKPPPRDRQLYFCKRDDLDVEIGDLREASLVELRAPVQQLEQGSLDDLNAWFDRRVRESQGPGVRAIVAMTHAMFMRGAPDPFRDTDGADFQKLDDHLTHVRRAHPGVRFVTASEAVLEFLDYSAPAPRAVAVKPRARSVSGTTFIYPIRILGKGIPISPDRPASLTVFTPPLFDPENVRTLTVLERGAEISRVEPKANEGALPSIDFQATGRDGYDLRVEVTVPIVSSLAASAAAPALHEKGPDAYEEWIEDVGPDLLRVESPTLLTGPPSALSSDPGTNWEWALPGDLFNILINPVGGSSHPIGRRFHPYAMVSEGALLYCASVPFSGLWTPEISEIKWVSPVRGKADFRLLCKLESMTDDTRELSASLFEAGICVATGRIVLRPHPRVLEPQPHEPGRRG